MFEYAQFATYLPRNPNGYTPQSGNMMEPLPAYLRPSYQPPNPWGRGKEKSGLAEDFIMLAEFSELEGPKPLLTIPKDGGSNFDQNSFSVRILAVDHQSSSEGFSISEDAQVVLSDVETGVFAFVHHLVLFDNTARGFVRPYCIAYVTSDQRKLMHFYEDLSQQFKKVARYLKYGNKMLFVGDLERHLKDLDHTKGFLLNQVSKMRLRDPEGGNSQGQDMRKNAENELYRGLQTIRQSSTEIREILSILKPLLSDKKLEARFRLLEERAFQEGSPSGLDKLSLQENWFNDLSALEELDVRCGSLNEPKSPLTLFRPREYKPVLVETKKAKRFNAPLRGLHELCSWGAKEGLKRLRHVHEYFKRDTLILELEKNESRLIRPLSTNISHGHCISGNFMAGVHMQRFPSDSVSEKSWWSAYNCNHTGLSGSFESLDSFKSAGSFQDSDFNISPSSVRTYDSQSVNVFESMPSSLEKHEISLLEENEYYSDVDRQVDVTPVADGSTPTFFIPSESNEELKDKTLDSDTTDGDGNNAVKERSRTLSSVTHYKGIDFDAIERALKTCQALSNEEENETVSSPTDNSMSGISDSSMNEKIVMNNDQSEQSANGSAVDAQFQETVCCDKPDGTPSKGINASIPNSTSLSLSNNPPSSFWKNEDNQLKNNSKEEEGQQDENKVIKERTVSPSSQRRDSKLSALIQNEDNMKLFLQLQHTTTTGVTNAKSSQHQATLLYTSVSDSKLLPSHTAQQDINNPVVIPTVSSSVQSESLKAYSSLANSPKALKSMSVNSGSSAKFVHRISSQISSSPNRPSHGRVSQLSSLPYGDEDGYAGRGRSESDASSAFTELSVRELFPHLLNSGSESLNTTLVGESSDTVDAAEEFVDIQVTSYTGTWKPRSGLYAVGDWINNLGTGRPGYCLHEILSSYTNIQHVLFSLLCDRPVLVAGPAKMQVEVVKVVNALSAFVPAARKKRQVVLDWTTKPLRISDLSKLRLVGICRPERKMLDSFIPQAVKKACTMFDVERRVIISPSYQGQLITSLISKKKVLKTDQQFLPYLEWWLMDLSMKSFIFFHTFVLGSSGSILYSHNPREQRDSYQSIVSFIMARLGIKDSDCEVIEYLAEMVKISRLEPHVWNGSDTGNIVTPLHLQSRKCQTFRC